MAIAGGLSGAGAALYYLAGNTEFLLEHLHLPARDGLQRHPVALLAANNPIGVVFTGIFMSMLDIAGCSSPVSRLTTSTSRTLSSL